MDLAIDCPAGLNSVILGDGPHFVEGRLCQVVVEGVGEPPPRRFPFSAGPRLLQLLPRSKVSFELKTQTSNVPAVEAHDDRTRLAWLPWQDMRYL